MNLSIIIPVKNEAANLDACLQSIREAPADGIDYEVLVIDNGSDDETVAVAKIHNAKVSVVPDATVAGLRNVGAEHSKGDILAFIDADCTVSSSWFESIVPYISRTDIICFGNPPGIPLKSTWVQRCWYQIRRNGNADDGPVPTEWLESMNLFIRRDAFVSVGGFDVSLITCEDYDLGVRLKVLGPIYSDPRIEAVHHGEAATLRRFYEKERWRGVSNMQSLRLHGFALSELPSVLFPLSQTGAVLVAIVALLFALTGVYPIVWWFVGILIWQTPLVLMGLRKASPQHRWVQAAGIVLLLNVYFLARGKSLFTGGIVGLNTTYGTGLFRCPLQMDGQA